MIKVSGVSVIDARIGRGASAGGRGGGRMLAEEDIDRPYSHTMSSVGICELSSHSSSNFLPRARYPRTLLSLVPPRVLPEVNARSPHESHATLFPSSRTSLNLFRLSRPSLFFTSRLDANQSCDHIPLADRNLSQAMDSGWIRCAPTNTQLAPPLRGACAVACWLTGLAAAKSGVGVGKGGAKSVSSRLWRHEGSEKKQGTGAEGHRQRVSNWLALRHAPRLIDVRFPQPPPQAILKAGRNRLDIQTATTACFIFVNPAPEAHSCLSSTISRRAGTRHALRPWVPRSWWGLLSPWVLCRCSARATQLRPVIR